MLRYWLVGADFGIKDAVGDAVFETFIQCGYWEMTWYEGDNSVYDQRVQSMRPGDGIAIKALLGQGQSYIRIRAIGIVTRVEGRRVYVDWKNTYPHREVDSKGCYGTIHGPFYDADNREWLDEVFRLV